jgi:hypothetical protein
MSEGALDRKKFETIEAYVLDTMSAEERVRFEQDLSADPALRAEVDMQRENMMAVELGGLTRTLRSLSAEENGVDERRSGPRYWMYAAAVVLLGIGATWWFTRPPLNERLFAQYFVADPGLPVEMGVANDPAFADAMVAYKLGDYPEARAKWSRLREQRPGNDTLDFYVASAALAVGDAEASITDLKRIVENSGSPFHDKSRWYLFLAYLHTDRSNDAWALGLENDPLYGEQVRTIKAAWNE